MTSRTKQEIEFSVFLINHLAAQWNMSTSNAYKVLDETGVLSGYVIPCYDTLHTLGIEYLADDITEFVRERGMCV